MFCDFGRPIEPEPFSMGPAGRKGVMKIKAGVVTGDVKQAVDDVIAHVGKEIVFSMPLALSKPIRFVNELYRRAKADSQIKLKIITALALEKPVGKSSLEARLVKPIAERIFAGTPDFDYMLDFRAGKLPQNVEIFEFFSKAGGYLNEPVAQQNHLCSNYTHAVRDAIDLGTNVFGMLLGSRKADGRTLYSLGSNTDITVEGIREVNKARDKGKKVAIVGEVNENVPFMYGDAVIEAETCDVLLAGPDYNYPLFGPPKDAVTLRDHMIGINVSTLVKDGGTIQVGIGALGDAIVNALIMRNESDQAYFEVLEKAGLRRRYAGLIEAYGDTGPFRQGLYGSSEMFVDAFMQMYQKGILKRKVFDSIPLMQLINAGKLSADSIPEDIIDTLIEMKAIHCRLTREDFDFLTEFGILKKGLTFEDGAIVDGDRRFSGDLADPAALGEIRQLLGSRLEKGTVILAAFFIGPREFYHRLSKMSEEERALFAMSGVETVNTLFGGEELRRLQRKDGRFINTGMFATLLGAISSDQLEDGRVVSGIGGQYNFASMAQELKDGRLIMTIRSTRGSGKNLTSSIVFSYGHCSVPKHLRDIVVTEYGIADLRGKPDKEVIMEMLKIADSRFQPRLLKQAKKAKKIPADWEIPEEYRHNTPEKISAILSPFQPRGFFQQFPFGTDLTENEVILGGALKAFQALQKAQPLQMVRKLWRELRGAPQPEAVPFLTLMKLDKISSPKEFLMQKIVLAALRHGGVIK